MKFICIITFLVASLIAVPDLTGQEEETTKPLELPNYVIEGKGQINVRSGVKQYPGIVEKLTAAELDSINSLQKEQTVLLPPKPLPERIFVIPKRKGFIAGSFGSYITPNLEGGYNFAVNRYKMFANAKLDISSGDPINSDYSKLTAGIKSEYLAPEKFFIFGGSITNTNLNFVYNNYNLYASRTAPDRTLFNMLLSVKSKGNYQGYDFRTGGHYSYMNMTTEGNSLSDNGLNAYLHFNNYWRDFLIGGGAEIDFHSLRGNGMSYITLKANGQYRRDKLIFDAAAGLQFGNTTRDATLFNFLIDLSGKFMLNKEFTFSGRFLMNMENSNFQQYYKINPYISDTAFFDYPVLTELSAKMNYHPVDDILIAFGASFGGKARHPYFENADSATFILKYGSSTLFNIFSEGNWYLSDVDALIYQIQMNMNYIDGKTIPYAVPLLVSASYNRRWFEKLGTTIGANYISSRFVNLENTKEISGYIDIFFNADYKINEKFNIFIKLNNLLNQNIYIWNGYRERGLFFSGGVLYRF